MPLIDLVNQSGNEAILSLLLVAVSTDDCGYMSFTTKNAMVSHDCNMAGVSSASSSHITIHGTAAKIQPVRKILLLGTPTLKDFTTTERTS